MDLVELLDEDGWIVLTGDRRRAPIWAVHPSYPILLSLNSHLAVDCDCDLDEFPSRIFVPEDVLISCYDVGSRRAAEMRRTLGFCSFGNGDINEIPYFNCLISDVISAVRKRWG